MKMRLGFVSNSSSSSFILPKKGLTPEQNKVISSWIHRYNMRAFDDHCVYETSSYFFGSVSYHCNLEDLLVGLKIPKEQYELED